MKAIPFFAFVFLASTMMFCSSEPVATQTEENQEDKIAITQTVVKGDVEKTTAKIALKGMSCEKMCGSMIKKCLKGIDGITDANIDFDPQRQDDFATVEFEPKKVTEKEMIAAIQKLNNGAYKVQSIEIITSEVTYEKLETEEPLDKTKKEKGAKVTAFHTPSFQVPNIFGVLAKFIPAIK